MVVPSEWIPGVFGDDEDSRWETMDQARHAIGLLMLLQRNRVRPGSERTPILSVAHPKMARDFDPIDDPERHAAVLAALPVCAIEIYER
jgi:hypothetical protein